MSAGHARLGPSNHRWPHCPGSVREEAAYPDIPGAAAIDGTGDHTLLELCLTSGVRAETYDQQIIGVNHPDNPGGWLVGKERVERVQQCLDYVKRRHTELSDQFPGSKITIEAESRSDPGGAFGRIDWWGTSDITITVINKHNVCQFVETIDYKGGRERVPEKDNTQLLAYDFGKMRPYIASGPELVRPFDPSRVGGTRVTIVQPKTNPPVRYDEPTPREIVDVVERLAWAAQRTDDPNAPLVSGDHCRWCKHKPNCAEYNSDGIEALKTMTTTVAVAGESQTPMFELLESAITDLANVDATQLADLADTRDRINALYDKIETEIERRVTLGQPVPGYEMGDGNGSNKWNKPDEEIAKMLKARRLKTDDIYPKHLISPAQVQKLESLTAEQKAKIAIEYVSYVASKKKILKKVAREKQQPSAELMFAGVGKSLFTDAEAAGAEVIDFAAPAPVDFAAPPIDFSADVAIAEATFLSEEPAAISFM